MHKLSSMNYPDEVSSVQVTLHKKTRMIRKNYVCNLFHWYKSELTANPVKILKPPENISFLDLVIIVPYCKSIVKYINL